MIELQWITSDFFYRNQAIAGIHKNYKMIFLNRSTFCALLIHRPRLRLKDLTLIAIGLHIA